MEQKKRFDSLYDFEVVDEWSDKSDSPKGSPKRNNALFNSGEEQRIKPTEGEIDAFLENLKGLVSCGTSGLEGNLQSCIPQPLDSAKSSDKLLPSENIIISFCAPQGTRDVNFTKCMLNSSPISASNEKSNRPTVSYKPDGTLLKTIFPKSSNNFIGSNSPCITNQGVDSSSSVNILSVNLEQNEEIGDGFSDVKVNDLGHASSRSSRPRASLEKESKYRVKRSPEHSRLKNKSPLESIKESTFSRERANSRREIFNERISRDKRRVEDRIKESSRSRSRERRSRHRSRTPSRRKRESRSSSLPRRLRNARPTEGKQPVSLPPVPSNAPNFFPPGSSIIPQQPSSVFLAAPLPTPFTNPPNMAFPGAGPRMIPFPTGKINDGTHVKYPSYSVMPSQPQPPGEYQPMPIPYPSYPATPPIMYPIPQNYGAYPPSQPPVRPQRGPWKYPESCSSYPLDHRIKNFEYIGRKRSPSPNHLHKRSLPKDESQYGDMASDSSPPYRRYSTSSSSESEKSHKRKSKKHSRSPDLYRVKERKSRRSKSSDSWHEKEKRQRMGSTSMESRKRSSDDYDRVKTNISQTRIPTPPPPPILSSDHSKSKYQTREKSADQKQSKALDKEPVSLSCLLEAVMETSGQGKSQLNDPKVKNEILAQCENKIRQLYKRRIAGKGAFFPDPVKTRLVNAHGSPLVTYHPHLSYNEGPEVTHWRYPGIKVPPVRKMVPLSLVPQKPSPISTIVSENRGDSPVKYPQSTTQPEKQSYKSPVESTSWTGFGTNVSLTYPEQQGQSSANTNYWGGTVNTDALENKNQPVDKVYHQSELVSYPQHLMKLKNVSYPLDVKPNYVTQEVTPREERRSLSRDRCRSRSRSSSRSRKKRRSGIYSERKERRSSKKSKKKKKKRSSSRTRHRRGSTPKRHESSLRYDSPVKYDIPRPDITKYDFPIRHDVYRPEPSLKFDPYRPVPPVHYDSSMKFVPYTSDTSANYNLSVKYDPYRPDTSVKPDAYRPDTSVNYAFPTTYNVYPAQYGAHIPPPVPQYGSHFNCDVYSSDAPKQNYTVSNFNQNILTLVVEKKNEPVKPSMPVQPEGFVNNTVSQNKPTLNQMESPSKISSHDPKEKYLNKAGNKKNDFSQVDSKNNSQINKNCNLNEESKSDKSSKRNENPTHEGGLFLKKIFSIAPEVRKMQEKSLLYNGIIQTIEKGDKAYNKLYVLIETALFKIVKPAQPYRLVVPRDNFKDVFNLLHSKFHDINHENMVTNVLRHIYPWSPHIPKIISKVFTECPTCKLQPRKIEPLIDKTSEKKQNNKSEKSVDTKTVKSRSPLAVKKEESSKKRESSTHSSSSQKQYSDRDSKYHDDVKGSKAKSDGAPCGYEKATKSRIQVTKQDTENIDKPSEDVADGKSSENSTALIPSNANSKDIPMQDQLGFVTRDVPLQQQEVASTAVSQEQLRIPDSNPPTTNVTHTKATAVVISNSQNTVPSNDTIKQPAKENKEQKNESNLDFKSLVRNVQMNEYGEIIKSIESGDKSKNSDDMYILKGGMLCRKLMSASGIEVKIIAPLPEIESIISIVHRMSSVHTPPQKMIAFFNKHFTPVEELENKVHEFVKKCNQCQN